MPDLSIEIANAVVASCQEGAEKAAALFSKALGQEFHLEVGDDGEFDASSLTGPGLLVVFQVGTRGAFLALPAHLGLVPAWCQHPDDVGQSKLEVLARELGRLFLPESLGVRESRAAWVNSLEGTISAAELMPASRAVAMTLTAQERSGPLALVWPCAKPAELGVEQEKESGSSPLDQSGISDLGSSYASSARGGRVEDEFSALPNYTRSLLQVSVPVTVTLAQKKLSVQEIIEMGPGSIINFEKLCDDLIELTVADTSIGRGEAVKVGEKFGIRILEMILPPERFVPVTRSREAANLKPIESRP